MTTPAAAAPALVLPSRFGHMYAGGGRITALRGEPGPAGSEGRSPEEWVVSTTTRWGTPPPGDRFTGLSHLSDGRLLREAVTADPDGWLGPAQSALQGAGDIGMLVKLLDPEQRLPVHAHPSRAWAKLHLAAPYGKTEAWYIVDTPAVGGQVHLGFEVPLTAGELVDHTRRGGGDLIGLSRPLTVTAGDVVVVPAGVPHAIGEGIFLVEVQEPTDQSLLLEWQGVISVPDEAARLGVAWPDVAEAIRLDPLDEAEIAALLTHPEPVDGVAVDLFGAAAGFFRGSVVSAAAMPVSFPAGVAGVVVLDGRGHLEWPGGRLAVTSGDVVVVPWATGEWSVSGVSRAVVARPAV